ncbi:hypothetical protein NLI96_g7625 [Meripilus lineatus]|uniref:Methyltransferase type 11 domain-containing protein n=1 Tax=Meripilus lineatus TaxID=2056292 RepID=A0AAD5V3Z2_9APHY|nr:hypothetical protein NLI96_g7625 [Physisporinus lineatus]
MATFGKATFNTARYAAIRPTYPRQLFDHIFQYHGRIPSARFDTAVDLGCGTGQATVELTPFRHIVGFDPSAKMIEQAKKGIAANGTGGALPGQLRYEVSRAESLYSVKDSSVDLVVSAQAAHWFDWAKLWPEVSRILREDGSIAIWGYSEFRLTKYAKATPLITEYAQGTDPRNSLGPYWQRPGRSIIENHFLDIPDPDVVVPGAFYDFQRIFFAAEEDEKRDSEVPGNEEEIDVEWPLALILAKRA